MWGCTFYVSLVNLTHYIQNRMQYECPICHEQISGIVYNYENYGHHAINENVVYTVTFTEKYYNYVCKELEGTYQVGRITKINNWSVQINPWAGVNVNENKLREIDFVKTVEGKQKWKIF